MRLTVGGTEVGHTRQTAELLQPVWGDRFAYGRPITALAAREVEIKLELIHDSHSTDLRAGDARVSSLETFTVTRGAVAFAPRLLRPYEPLRTTRALVDPAVQPPAERAAAAADAAAAKAIRDDVTAGVIGYLQLEVQLDDLYE